VVQPTESAGVVGVDDEFSRCSDFNRLVCRGDGFCPNLMFSFFLFHILNFVSS